MVHARELAFDVFGCVGQLFLDPGDVEKYSTVGTATPFLDFPNDAARDVIPGQQLGRPPRVFISLAISPAFFRIVTSLVFVGFGSVATHEAVALPVAKDASLPAHAF